MNFLEKITCIKNNIKDCPFCDNPITMSLNGNIIYCNTTECTTRDANNFYLSINDLYFKIKYKNDIYLCFKDILCINNELKLQIDPAIFIMIDFPFINEEKVKTLLVFQ